MKRKTILILLTLFLTLIFISCWKVFGPTVSPPDGNYLYIRTGETFGQVRDELISKKIISSGRWFDWVANALEFKMVKAGKYEIKESLSLFQLVRKLKNGRQTPVKLVITKLRLKEDFARRLGQLFEFDSLAAIRYLTNSDSLKQLGLDTNTVMAAVMPNTYSFYWNTTPEKVLKKLNDYREQFWNEERRKKAAAIQLNPVQVSILASIIDEESNYVSDKDTIASVYINRLKKNMPLQADPTIKFALKDFSLKRIYEKHLGVESPFNTYRNTGLPPGPICTAQPETIDIVLNTPQTDYLYFVANSDFSGTHIYSSNYADHLKWAKKFAEAQDQQDSIRKSKQ